MPNLEDKLTDDEIEDVEQAERESKRSKTKYGDKLSDE